VRSFTFFLSALFLPKNRADITSQQNKYPFRLRCLSIFAWDITLKKPSVPVNPKEGTSYRAGISIKVEIDFIAARSNVFFVAKDNRPL
jgi:hypothetical protein